MALSLITKPTAEPVDLTMAKAQLRVDSSDEDILIGDVLIPSARQWVESKTNRQLITAQYALTLPCFPASGIIRIPRPPLINADPKKPVVTYKDTAGVTQTLAAANYVVEAPSDPWAQPGRIVLAFGKTWPSTLDQVDAVTVTFWAGYGEAGTFVPPQLQWAQLLMLSEGFESRREQTVGDSVSKNEVTAEMLCGSFMVASFDLEGVGR